MIATPSRNGRAERAAVRALASQVEAARLDLAGRELALGDGGRDLDEAVDLRLAELWRRRFAGELNEPRDLPTPFADSAPLVELLFGQPCEPRLAERLAQAHELVLAQRLVARGRRVTLEPSGTRRSKGVYYTPPDVVAFIVERTLGQLLAPWEERIARASQRECLELLASVRALTVFDPACGGGAFLLGALRRLRACYQRLAERLERAPPELADPGRLALSNLRGLDLDVRALALAELALLAEVGHVGGERLLGRQLVQGDLLDLPGTRAAFAAAFDGPDPGFDVIVGNPPYAKLSAEQKEAARGAGFETWATSDIYHLFVEATCLLGADRARSGLIVPLSLLFSRATRPLREQVLATSGRAWRCASFDRIPSGLFEAEVRTRTTIVWCGPRRADGHTRIATGRLLRFTAEERPRVFERLELFDATGLSHPELGLPKLASELQATWLLRLRERGQRLSDGLEKDGPHRLHYKHNCYAFAIVASELPPAFDARERPVPQTKYSSLGFPSQAARDVALALTAGAWLFWWWLTYGDGFDVTGQLIGALPVDPRQFSAETGRALARLGRRIQTRAARSVVYKRNKNKRIGTFDLRTCRALTREADELVARELGAEELLEDVRAFIARTHGAG